MELLRWEKGICLGASALLLAGCAEFYRPNVGPVGEQHRPVLEAVWARSEIADGGLYRIHLRASDPDSDLDKVFITFGQYEATHPGELVILPASQRRRAKGYLRTWARLQGGVVQGPIYATARLRVEDRAGNVSEARTIRFTVNPEGIEQVDRPPQDFAGGVMLGQVDFPLYGRIRGD